MSTEMLIPKIFFQTSRTKLDQYLIDMIQSKLTPEWIYRHYIDTEILEYFKKHPIEEFKDIAERFQSIRRGEHKADLFRYYFLYIEGGVFMDSDAMIYEPIEQIILNYRFFSVNSGVVPNTIFQGIIGSEPKNPIIYKALQLVYSMDYTILQSDYHYLCKQIYDIFKKSVITIDTLLSYKLYNEIKDSTGDNTINDDGIVIFRHYWRNKESIPNILKKKSRNLVYFCVFYNADYFKLLELLLKSIKMYSNTDSIDFLVYTTQEFETKVKELSSKLKIQISIQCFRFTTIFEAACARLYIFEYTNIKDYTTILYLDTDILIKKDLLYIFSINLEDKLYGLKCGTIQSPSFGSQFFDFSTIDSSTNGINSGTLLFKNSKIIRELFMRIREHITIYTESKATIPYCMDQPFINYHAIKDKLSDTTVLNPLVSLYEGEDIVSNYTTSIICHFSYPIGNFSHKYNRMIAFFNTLLNTSSNSRIIDADCIERKYSWNGGYIMFVNSNTGKYLQTTWGKGEYTILDSHHISAVWNGFYHILKFNNDFTRYISIRTYPQDFEYSDGCIIHDSNLILYGDSHASLSFKNLAINNRNLFHFSITMHRIGRDKQIINFKKNHCNKNKIFCLSYGEVDVRCHIGKQVHLGRNHLEVCEELVKRYFETIKELITEYKAIIIVAILPPTDINDHSPCNIHTEATGGPLPFVGTNQDRIIYTECINSLLKKYCLEFNYVYFNPYSHYTREDGCLKYEMSDKCIHIADNTYFLEEFKKIYDNLNIS